MAPSATTITSAQSGTGARAPSDSRSCTRFLWNGTTTDSCGSPVLMRAWSDARPGASTEVGFSPKYGLDTTRKPLGHDYCPRLSSDSTPVPAAARVSRREGIGHRRFCRKDRRLEQVPARRGQRQRHRQLKGEDQRRLSQRESAVQPASEQGVDDVDAVADSVRSTPTTPTAVRAADA